MRFGKYLYYDELRNYRIIILSREMENIVEHFHILKEYSFKNTRL